MTFPIQRWGLKSSQISSYESFSHPEFIIFISKCKLYSQLSYCPRIIPFDCKSTAGMVLAIIIRHISSFNSFVITIAFNSGIIFFILISITFLVQWFHLVHTGGFAWFIILIFVLICILFSFSNCDSQAL